MSTHPSDFDHCFSSGTKCYFTSLCDLPLSPPTKWCPIITISSYGRYHPTPLGSADKNENFLGFSPGIALQLKRRGSIDSGPLYPALFNHDRGTGVTGANTVAFQLFYITPNESDRRVGELIVYGTNAARFIVLCYVYQYVPHAATDKIGHRNRRVSERAVIPLRSSVAYLACSRFQFEGKG